VPLEGATKREGAASTEGRAGRWQHGEGKASKAEVCSGEAATLGIPAN